MNSFEELFEISTVLKQAAESFEDESVAKNFDALSQSLAKVERSFSGSWLGYHSRVYYEGLEPAPPGAHFSQEWGLGGDGWLGLGSKGEWYEFDSEYVKAEILSRAGNPDVDHLRNIARKVGTAFQSGKSELLSILSAELEERDDNFISKLKDDLEGLEVVLKDGVIRRLRPSGQIMTRDTTALGQGIRTPPHFELRAELIALENSIGICKGASDVAAKAASHLQRRRFRKKASERVGTNVFIGHGRSQAWRELKDFLEGRLALPWDEFNRVPIAGVTNIARLSEMLDAAAIAFLIMTGEDQVADGETQARMNVIHEAGLFQGRLGFTKAIILLEDGCAEFSNIQGLGQIRFPKGKISAAFEEIRLILEREEILSI